MKVSSAYKTNDRKQIYYFTFLFCFSSEKTFPVILKVNFQLKFTAKDK